MGHSLEIFDQLKYSSRPNIVIITGRMRLLNWFNSYKIANYYIADNNDQTTFANLLMSMPLQKDFKFKHQFNVM